MFLVLSCNCLCPIYWSHMLSWEWRCSWSSADRRCSNYIWVINNLIVYKGAPYIREFTVFVFKTIFIVKILIKIFCIRLQIVLHKSCIKPWDTLHFARTMDIWGKCHATIAPRNGFKAFEKLADNVFSKLSKRFPNETLKIVSKTKTCGLQGRHWDGEIWH